MVSFTFFSFCFFRSYSPFSFFTIFFFPVTKLLWTEVFNKSSNNSGLQSMSFCHQRNAFITPEIPMALVDIHGVAFVSLCFRKDTRIFIYSMNTASPLLYWLTMLNPHVAPMITALCDVRLPGIQLLYRYWILQVWDF